MTDTKLKNQRPNRIPISQGGKRGATDEEEEDEDRLLLIPSQVKGKHKLFGGILPISHLKSSDNVSFTAVVMEFHCRKPLLKQSASFWSLTFKRPVNSHGWGGTAGEQQAPVSPLTTASFVQKAPAALRALALSRLEHLALSPLLSLGAVTVSSGLSTPLNTTSSQMFSEGFQKAFNANSKEASDKEQRVCSERKRANRNTQGFPLSCFFLTCDIGLLWHEELIEGRLRQALDIARRDLHFVSRVPLQRLKHREIVGSGNELGHPLLLFILTGGKRGAWS